MASTIKGTILLKGEGDSSERREFFPNTTLDQIEGLETTLDGGKKIIAKANKANKADSATYTIYDSEEGTKTTGYKQPIYEKYATKTELDNQKVKEIFIDKNKIILKDSEGFEICHSEPITTDTKLVVSNGPTGTSNVSAGKGNVHLNLVENDAVTNSINIKGSGSTFVTSSTTKNGQATITINTPELPIAGDQLGLVKINDKSNITIDAEGLISLTAENIEKALGYTPADDSTIDLKDTKVKQQKSTKNNQYPILASVKDSVNIDTGATTTAIFNPNINMNPLYGAIYANEFHNNYGELKTVIYNNHYQGDSPTGTIGTLTIDGDIQSLTFAIDDATTNKAGLMSTKDKTKLNQMQLANITITPAVSNDDEAIEIATIHTATINSNNKVTSNNTILYIPSAGDTKQVRQKNADTNKKTEYCILASDTLTSTSSSNHTDKDSVESYTVFNKDIRIKPYSGAVIANEFIGSLTGTANNAEYAIYDSLEGTKNTDDKQPIHEKYATKDEALQVEQKSISSDQEYAILAMNNPANSATGDKTLGAAFNKSITMNPKTKTITAKIFNGIANKATYAINDSLGNQIDTTYTKKTGDTFTGIMEYAESITIEDDYADNIIPNIEYVNKKFSVASNNHYTTNLVVGESKTATTDSTITDGNVYLNITDKESISTKATVHGSIQVVNGDNVAITSATVPSGSTKLIISATNDNDKVQQTKSTKNSTYAILLTANGKDVLETILSDDTINSTKFNTNIYANPSKGMIYAKGFTGSLNGNVKGDVTGDLAGTADYAIYDSAEANKTKDSDRISIDQKYATNSNASINNATLTGDIYFNKVIDKTDNSSLVANTEFVHNVIAKDENHYHNNLIVTNNKDSITAYKGNIQTNGDVYLNLTESESIPANSNIVRNAINIVGSGDTSVTSSIDSDTKMPKIIIKSNDANDKVQVNYKSADSINNKDYPLLASSKTIPSDRTNIDAAVAIYNDRIKMNPYQGIIYAKEFNGLLTGTVTGNLTGIADYAIYDSVEAKKAKDEDKQSIDKKYATKKEAISELDIQVKNIHDEDLPLGQTNITITCYNCDNESLNANIVGIDNSHVIQINKDTDDANMYPLLASNSTIDTYTHGNDTLPDTPDDTPDDNDTSDNTITSSNAKSLYERSIYTNNIYVNPGKGIIYANEFNGSLNGTAKNAIYDDEGNKIDTTYMRLSGDTFTGIVKTEVDVNDDSDTKELANVKYVQNKFEAATKDYHYKSSLIAGKDGSTINATADNGKVYIYLNEYDISNEKKNSQKLKIVGTGSTSVTSDNSGIITIYSKDTDTNDKVKQTKSANDSTYAILLTANGKNVLETISSGDTINSTKFSTNIYVNPSSGIIYANKFNGSLKGDVEGTASIATTALYDSIESTKLDTDTTKSSIVQKYATKEEAVGDITIYKDDTSTPGIHHISITSANINNGTISTKTFDIDQSRVYQTEATNSNEYPLLASDIIKDDIKATNNERTVFTKSIRINPSYGIIYATEFDGSLNGTSEYAIYDSNEATITGQKTLIVDKYALKNNGTLTGSSINNATLNSSYADDITDLTTNNQQIANTKFVQDVVKKDSSHYKSSLIAGKADSTVNTTASNDEVYIHLDEYNTNNEKKNSQKLKIIGTGSTSVTSDNNGIIIIYSQNDNDKVKQNRSNDNIEYPLLASSETIPSRNNDIGDKNAIFNENIKINPSSGAIYANTFNGILIGDVTGTASISTYARYDYDELSKGDTKQEIKDKYSTKKNAVNNLTINTVEDNVNGKTNITLTSNNIYAESINSKSFIIDNSKIIQKEADTSNEYPLLASNIIKDNIQSSNHTSALFTKSVRINPSSGIIYAKGFSGDLNGTTDKAINDSLGNRIDTTYATKLNDTIQGHKIINTTLSSSYADDISSITVNNQQIANAKFVQSVVAADSNHYHSTLITGNSSDSINTITDNTNTHIVLIENSVKSAIQLTGTGAASISSNADGIITIYSQNDNDKVKQNRSSDNIEYPLLASSKTIPSGSNNIGDEDVIFNENIKINPSLGAIYANTFIGNIQGDITGEASISTYARYDYDELSKGDTKQEIKDKYSTNKNAVNNFTINTIEDNVNGKTNITLTSNNIYAESIDSKSFVIDNSKIIQTEATNSNEYPLLASNIIKDNIQANNHTSALFTKSIRINPSSGIIYANKFNGSFDGTSEYAIYDDEETSEIKTKIKDKYALKINGTLSGSSINNATLNSSYADDIDDLTTNNQQIANTKFVQSVMNKDGNHWRSKLITGSKNDTINTITDNTNTHIVLIEQDSIRSSVQLIGAGITSVSSNADGKIIISSTDTNDKVQQNIITNNNEYPILIASNPNAVDNIEASQINFSSNVHINPSLGAVTAEKFKGYLEGVASLATNATSANTATYAINDMNGNKIDDTYVKQADVITSIDTNTTEHILTFNKNNQVITKSIADNTVQQQYTNTETDEYPLLASSSIASSLTTNVTTTAKFNKDITINPSKKAITAASFIGSLSGTATNAVNDEDGNNIKQTYINKNQGIVDISISGTTLTFTRGNNDVHTITTQDNDIDITVQQDKSIDNTTFPLLATPVENQSASTYTGKVIYGEGIKINPSMNSIIATTFDGNATSATKAENDGINRNIADTYALKNGDTISNAILANANLTGVPLAPTAEATLSSDQIATTRFVATAINNLIGDIPSGAFNTFGELVTNLNTKQQKYDALTSIGSLTTSANQMLYTTASNTYTVTAFTPLARDLLDDLTQDDMRTTINALGKSEKAASALVADTADKLTIPKTITISDGTHTGSPVNFDGSENITITLPETISAVINGSIDQAIKLSSAINITITDADEINSGVATSFDGSSNINIKLPSLIKAALEGNATTATTANKAINDNYGNQINTTYVKKENAIKKIEVNNSTHKLIYETNAAENNRIELDIIDVNVKQNATTNNSTYPILIAAQANATDDLIDNVYFDPQVKINPYNSEVIATTFTGNLNGTANKTVNDKNGIDIADNYVTKNEAITDLEVAGRVITYVKGGETITHTITSDDTDVKVQQTLADNESKTYPLLASAVENQNVTCTESAVFSSNIKINPSAAEIIANKFTGDLDGTANKAIKDGNNNNIVNTYMPKVYKNTVTLNPSAWTEENGLYTAQFTDTNITDNYLVNIIISKDSLAIATMANMLSINENYGNYIKLYAQNQPTDNITLIYYAYLLAS